MLKEFFISLFGKYYQPGEQVSGEVTLFLEEAKHFQSIEVILCVQGNVKFSTKFVSRNVHSRQVINYQVVWKVESEGDTLCPGNHTWPFSLTLQRGASLSPSFEGKYGYIRYSVECRIIKSKEQLLKKKPRSVEKMIEVKTPVQMEKDRLQPVIIQKEAQIKVFHLCASSTTNVIMRTELFRGGFYALDDAIVFQIQLENESRKSINRINVGLWKYVEYRAGEHMKKEGELLREVNSELIPPNCYVLWQPLPFYINSLSASLTDHSLIAITYILEVSAVVSGTTPLKVEIPLFLCNTPLLPTEVGDPSLASVQNSLPHSPANKYPPKLSKPLSPSGAEQISDLSLHPYAYANFQTPPPRNSKSLT